MAFVLVKKVRSLRISDSVSPAIMSATAASIDFKSRSRWERVKGGLTRDLAKLLKRLRIVSIKYQAISLSYLAVAALLPHTSVSWRISRGFFRYSLSPT